MADADEWAARLARDPLFASSMGVDTYNDALPDVTPESQRRELDEDRAFLARLEAIDRSALGKEDQLNYDLFDFIVRSRATLAQYRPYLIPILADGGFHMWIQRMYESMPFENAADYEDYLARLNALGADIQMVLDECAPLPSPPEVIRTALDRTRFG